MARLAAVPERVKLPGEQLIPGMVTVGPEGERGVMLDCLVLVDLDMNAALRLARVDEAHAEGWHVWQDPQLEGSLILRG